MKKISQIERADFFNKNIEMYSKNKIGQYSKFLDKNPTFVTYYHINRQQSTVDSGTLSIERELGLNSPTRFNKITAFPVYNIPEIKPDVMYDESGMDLEVELSDVVILPKTIKPMPGDYMLVTYPGSKEFLFRVNNFRYNTIQSNDYYLIDMDLKDIGDNLEMLRDISHQVVETYQTVFDNIGTNDSCFVRSTDIGRLNNILDLADTLKDWYKNTFYRSEINSFTTKVHSDADMMGKYIYDPYLENFINKSNIYFEENNVTDALVLVPNDIHDTNFNTTYNKTIFHAVLTRNMEFLANHQYIIPMPITNSASLYAMYDYNADSIMIFTTPKRIKSDYDMVTKYHNLYPAPTTIPAHSQVKEYTDIEFLHSLKTGDLETDKYIELLIYDFLRNNELDVDRKEVIHSLDNNEFCFRHVPILIYILQTMFIDYFKIESEVFN